MVMIGVKAAEHILFLVPLVDLVGRALVVYPEGTLELSICLPFFLLLRRLEVGSLFGILSCDWTTAKPNVALTTPHICSAEETHTVLGTVILGFQR